MSDEYMPTTDEVRDQWTHNRDAIARRPWGESYTDAWNRRRVEFDRWLAEVKRAAAEKAWDEEDVATAARAEAARRWPDYPHVGFSGADDRQMAFIEGAEWASGVTPTGGPPDSAVATAQPCRCGHPRGWHYLGAGSCLECPCSEFEAQP